MQPRRRHSPGGRCVSVLYILRQQDKLNDSYMYKYIYIYIYFRHRALRDGAWLGSGLVAFAFCVASPSRLASPGVASLRVVLRNTWRIMAPTKIRRVETSPSSPPPTSIRRIILHLFFGTVLFMICHRFWDGFGINFRWIAILFLSHFWTRVLVALFSDFPWILVPSIFEMLRLTLVRMRLA